MEKRRKNRKRVGDVEEKERYSDKKRIVCITQSYRQRAGRGENSGNF